MIDTLLIISGIVALAIPVTFAISGIFFLLIDGVRKLFHVKQVEVDEQYQLDYEQALKELG